jgi:hypothetical protein
MSKGRDKDIEVGKVYVIEDDEVNPCDLCARRTTELAALSWEKKDGSKGVDYACESCRAVLEVAQGLLGNKVKDENEIITTIALAAYAGLSWIDAENQSSAVFGQEYPGLEFSRDMDGMPLFRMLPMLIDVVRYEGTQFTREVRIEVSSRVITAEEVATQYEQTLLKERIPSENCVGMSLECDTDDLTLTVTVKPRAELHPHGIRYHTTYPQAAPYHFPPPNIIRGWCKELLGSIHPRTFRGIAYALGDHDRSQTKWPKANILACLAWCFGENDDSSRPAERRPRISKALNRHLLSRYAITFEFPEDSWSSDQAVWADVGEVAPRFKRASYLWQRSAIR